MKPLLILAATLCLTSCSKNDSSDKAEEISDTTPEKASQPDEKVEQATKMVAPKLPKDPYEGMNLTEEGKRRFDLMLEASATFGMVMVATGDDAKTILIITEDCSDAWLNPKTEILKQMSQAGFTGLHCKVGDKVLAKREF